MAGDYSDTDSVKLFPVIPHGFSGYDGVTGAGRQAKLTDILNNLDTTLDTYYKLRSDNLLIQANKNVKFESLHENTEMKPLPKTPLFYCNQNSGPG
jgi:hypothetical protein